MVPLVDHFHELEQQGECEQAENKWLPYVAAVNEPNDEHGHKNGSHHDQ
jgi:hypothetical protein